MTSPVRCAVLVSSLFIAFSLTKEDQQLIEVYREVVVQVDEEVHMAAVFASFAATSARGEYGSDHVCLLKLMMSQSF